MTGNPQKPIRRAHRASTVVVRPGDIMYVPGKPVHKETSNGKDLHEESYLSDISCSSSSSEKKPDNLELGADMWKPGFAKKASTVYCNKNIGMIPEDNVSYGKGNADSAVFIQGHTNGFGESVRDRIKSLESNPQDVYHQLPRKIPQGGIEERTNNFHELLDAFKTIEKRTNDDSANRVLKKFRTNDECSEERTTCTVPDIALFPRIKNNPFVKWDAEVRIEPFSEEQIAPSTPQRGQRRLRRSSSRSGTLYWERQ